MPDGNTRQYIHIYWIRMKIVLCLGGPLWNLDFGHVVAVATNEIRSQAEQPNKPVDQTFDKYFLALKFTFMVSLHDRRDWRQPFQKTLVKCSDSEKFSLIFMILCLFKRNGLQGIFDSRFKRYNTHNIFAHGLHLVFCIYIFFLLYHVIYEAVKQWTAVCTMYNQRA